MNNTYNIFSAWRFDLNKEIQWSIFSKDVSASSYDKAMYKAVGENQEPSSGQFGREFQGRHSAPSTA